MATTATQAEAFNQFSILCGNDTSRSPSYSGSDWSLSFNGAGGGGSLDLEDVVHAGYNAWTQDLNDRPRAENGTPAFTTGGSFTQQWVSDSFINGADAFTNCIAGNHSYNESRIPVFRVQHLNFLAGISTHEWGHAWGLGHSGKNDSWFGTNPPTMATCLSTADAEKRFSLANDDYGGAAHISHSTLNPSTDFNYVSPNRSMQYGRRFWKTTSASTLTTSGRWDGTGLRMLQPSTWNNWISNTVRVADSYQSVPAGTDISVHGDKLHARAHFKHGTGTQGSIVLRAKVRGVRFVNGSDVGCQFLNDLLNNPLAFTPYVTSTKYCGVSSSWNSCAHLNLSVPEFSGQPNSDNPDAADVSILVSNRTLKANGQRAEVHLDNVGIEWDFTT